MNFKFETQGTNTYIVYEIDKSEMMDSMTLGMITNNKIPGLAQAFFFQQDNTKYVKYNISSKVSAEQFLMGTVNKKRLIGVFKGIVNAMISAEEYMIDASSLCLDLDYIYTDVTTCETVVLCLPISDAEKPLVDLKAFFKNIVFSVQFDQTENGDYIAKLINYLNSASSFSLYDFKEVLDVIEYGQKQVSASEQTPQQSVSQVQTQVVQQASVSQMQPQASIQQPTPQVQPQSVVQQTPQQQTSIPRPTAVPQTPIQQEKSDFGQNQASNAAFAIPGQSPDRVPGQVVQEKNEPIAQSEEKEISWFYLMQHYNKENAALYKAQKEAKKATKATGNPSKADKKKDKKEKKNKKDKGSTPSAAPNADFAIPGQTPQSMSQLTGGYIAPVERPVSVPQSTPQSVVPQSAPTPQAPPVQPTSQMYQMPQMQVQSQTNINFGETTVLSSAGIGETTVLGATSIVMENTPHLIRTKNNERIMVDKPVFRIGKEKSFVDYFIGDNTAISRSHANIITREGEYFVQDTNSTNHTYVDGQMIQSNVEVKITHGTKIKLANEDFEFKIY